MSRRPKPPRLVPCKYLKDAYAVACRECDLLATIHDPVPWGLSNTKGMHERGTGHRMDYLTWEDED